MKPVVDRLATAYEGQVDFVVYGEVNSSAEISDFAFKQRVTAIPTTMLVSPEGEELRRFVGSMPEADLRGELDALSPR